MGRKLHRLGAFAFKHPFIMIGSWLAILAILGVLAVQFMKPTSSAISIPGTEAQKALDRMAELFPDSGRGSGRVVFASSSDKTIEDFKADVTKLSGEISKIDSVVRVIDYTENPAAISKDKTIAYTQIQLQEGQGTISETTIQKINDKVDDARKAGLQIETGGDIIKRTPGNIIGPTEIGGVVIALLVLILTLGSLIAAGMPIATAFIAVGVSMAGLFSLSEVMEIGSTTPVLAVMLGLAVGIDYSLFIINRYRMYLLEGYSFQVSASRAIGTAGNAVIFAAATVVIALSALSVTGIPFMTTMGLAAAAAIIIAAMVAITLVPALLRLAGPRVFSRRMRRVVEKAQKAGAKENHHADRTTFWYRWGAALTKYPLVVVLACLALIITIALPIRNLDLGLPTDQFAAHDRTERKAYDLLTKGFGAGFNGPLLIVTEDLPVVSDADKAAVREQAMKQFEEQSAKAAAEQQATLTAQAATLEMVEQQIAFQQQVAQLQQVGEQKKAEALAGIEKSVDQYAKLVQLKKVADVIAKDRRVVSAAPAIATEDGTKGLIQVIPASGPSDQQTTDLINDLRDISKREELTGRDNIRLYVTGTTALQNDIDEKLAAALPLYLVVVVGLSIILLIVAFRSILVPLKATIGFLLSVLAMFGALVAVFQWGWFGIAEAPGPIVNFAPIIAIGILFGLAMDYEFFLVTSMHEAYQDTKDAHRSVLRGFAHASKVVLAAAVIMVAVFTGFVFSHDSTIQSIGFALAFGIFIDAFVVRLTIVPAVMVLLDKAAWWIPKWLDKILPHLSIEGEDAKK